MKSTEGTASRCSTSAVTMPSFSAAWYQIVIINYPVDFSAWEFPNWGSRRMWSHFVIWIVHEYSALRDRQSWKIGTQTPTDRTGKDVGGSQLPSVKLRMTYAPVLVTVCTNEPNAVNVTRRVPYQVFFTEFLDRITTRLRHSGHHYCILPWKPRTQNPHYRSTCPLGTLLYTVVAPTIRKVEGKWQGKIALNPNKPHPNFDDHTFQYENGNLWLAFIFRLVVRAIGRR